MMKVMPTSIRAERASDCEGQGHESISERMSSISSSMSRCCCEAFSLKLSP